MAFCINCGQQLPEGAKFCAECGTTTNQAGTQKRRVVFDGQVHKCPNCGELLKSFMANCPACGHELRDITSTSSVKQLALKLQEIESTRPAKKRLLDHTVVSKTDEQKVTLIRSFAIPNTKEDLLEFFILASSNISMERYSSMDDVTESQKAVSDAWEAKFEQAYHKAKVSFGGTFDFNVFESLYKKRKSEIEKSKKKNVLKWAGLVGLVVFCLAIVFGIYGIIFAVDDNKIEAENERLEAIVAEVYQHINNQEYILARSKASSLVFSGSTTKDGDQAAAKWDATRKQLLDIIDKAEYGDDYVSRPKEITIGVSHDSLKGDDYQDVKQQLENRGFTNIKLEPYEDSTTGWWTSEGSVEKVSVGSETAFLEDDVFMSDVEIIIYYHLKQ